MQSSDNLCEIFNPLEGQRKRIERRSRTIKETEKKKNKATF
jgi:hypothetical protein